jgi:radical SAM superfamily enzyme YgiQ (UPF0313 family)
MKKKILIYFADLTHKGAVLSSNVFPLSIGLIASYLLEKHSENIQVELFKYPEDFNSALEKRTPDIVAFANYSWNFRLSYEYVRIIKRVWPDITIVFGGPNYGLESEEVNRFWGKYNLIDFYIVREGEEAFCRLVVALMIAEMSPSTIKSSRQKLPNCHYMIGDEIIVGPELPRLTLEDVPSPYLMGLMDKFFDENLGPMIHTTRGCPFHCAYCTEGSPYYNIVEQRIGTLKEELHYIAQRVIGPLDLYISDANFGMFKQDVQKAELLAECQHQYGYPRHIHVSTGKNQKDRVIQIAQLLDGAVSIAASLQSTDPIVLDNISRSNISISKLTTVGKLANKVDAGTYSEIILGLPGDSFDAHQKSLRDCVHANFDNIRMYQLIMLPQTELNTSASRHEFGIKSKYRVMPRSFGQYTLAGNNFIAVESEEILVENLTLSFVDYIRCRELDLTVELLHNGKVYEELQSYCEIYGLSWFDFILRFYEKRRNYGDGICAMYDDFREGLTSRLWETREELENVVTDNINEMLNNERGTNEMSTGKATGFFVLFKELNQVLFNEMKSWLEELDLLDEDTEVYLDELCHFSYIRKTDLMDISSDFIKQFTFDVDAMATSHFTLLPEQVKLSKPKYFKFLHLKEQREQITVFTNEFGKSHDGMGKMLMRYPHIHRLFRHPQPAEQG